MWRRSFVAPRPSTDVLHTEPIDEDVGRGVVADDDHERRVVADRERRRAELKQHAGAANRLRAVERDRVVEPNPAFGGLPEELVDNRELDGRRGGKRFALEVRDAVAGREVEHRVADDAIDARRDLLETLLEFRAQFRNSWRRLLRVQPGLKTRARADSARDRTAHQARHRNEPPPRA